MFRKLVGALFVMAVVIGFSFAEEFGATITKVDGNKITYQKYKKKQKGEKVAEKDGDPVTIEVAKDAKIVKGTVMKGKAEVGDPIEGGLKSETFTKVPDKGIPARITTDDDKKVATQILVITPKKKAAQ
jgi:hypothetical protein